MNGEFDRFKIILLPSGSNVLKKMKRKNLPLFRRKLKFHKLQRKIATAQALINILLRRSSK